MGHAGARCFVAVCAAALSWGAQAQPLTKAELESLPGELQLTYCAMTNLDKLKESKESAEAVATAAVALCKSEKSRIIAESRGNFSAWEYHRRSMIDNLIALIVQRRLNAAIKP